jgi:peptidoglycan-associated lipoprotein
MTPSPYAKSALRLTVLAAAAVSFAACSSRPKPQLPVSTPTPPSASQPAPTNQPPPVASQSIGAVPGSQQDFVINVGERVYFDFDSYSIRGDAQPVLAAQAGWLRRYPNVRVRIEGNADQMGTREYNLALGARRANAVRDYLVSNGVTADRIATVSYGKEQPIDAGSGEEADAKNRNARTALISGAQ